MAYDEVLAQRIHDLVDGEEGWTSKKMFGGLGFMLDGHMAVAAGSSGVADGARRPGRTARSGSTARPCSRWRCAGARWPGGSSSSQDALAGDDQLELWVDRGATFVRTLPPK